MIERDAFYGRLTICKQCEHWRGACLKGHVLQGALGCPIRKFEGVQGTGFMEDLPVPAPELPGTGGAGCCGASAEEDLKPLTWGEVWRHFSASMETWKKAGYPLLEGEAYQQRISACRGCAKGQYRWFQCRHCKCIVYTKAKLATEDCPYGLWPKAKGS